MLLLTAFTALACVFLHAHKVEREKLEMLRTLTKYCYLASPLPASA